ncbi:hypothetical protein [Ehrlichia canis]|uniref:hypothetical protein n=1 Tax=Ehrlichia canis TaxID=944 RepID=UPI000C852DDB|nr:hypothetical protein [Ehrlichia canis]AUO54492.1 hypothetical protein C1I72_01055 [Ehrlichia canis]UKC53762.1 hypothetical protein s20019040002_000805 [Ehrlichia canis]UKC54700.1 hypothetical protein s20026770001_000806 [Ehrlichia canis]UKC55636.1 hypothetical protein s21009500007_000806 [Ehrlichia canis]
MYRDIFCIIVAVAVVLVILILLCNIGYMISCIKSLGNQIYKMETELSQCRKEGTEMMEEILTLYDEVYDVRNDLAYHPYFGNVKNGKKLVDGINNTAIQQGSCTLDSTNVEDLGAKREKDK